MFVQGSLGMGAISQSRSISRTFFQFLFLILILDLRVASTWFTRRDMLWDDSSWLEDVIGVGVGAFGFFYDILNTVTDTELQPTLQSPSLPGDSLETPDEQGPLSVPPSMKRCSAPKDGAPGDQADERGADYLWDLVNQDPTTGQLLTDDCAAPDNNPDDAYLVHEIRFIEGKVREKNWPAAILVTDLATGINIRYDVRQQGKIYLVRKVVNFKLLRQGQVIKLGHVRRRGWLIGAGQPKEQALIWFERYLDGVGYAAPPANVNEPSHFTAIWVRRVFTRLWLEPTRPTHWVPIGVDY